MQILGFISFMNHLKTLDQLNSILKSLNSYVSEQSGLSEFKAYIESLIKGVEVVRQHDKHLSKLLTAFKIFGKNSTLFDSLIQSQFDSLRKAINHVAPFSDKNSRFCEDIAQLLETVRNLFCCIAPVCKMELDLKDNVNFFDPHYLAALFTKNPASINTFSQ